MALGQLSSNSKKVRHLKLVLNQWDEQTGNEAEGCNSEVATKREGSPLRIRAMQEADYLEAASIDKVDRF